MESNGNTCLAALTEFLAELGDSNEAETMELWSMEGWQKAGLTEQPAQHTEPVHEEMSFTLESQNDSAWKGPWGSPTPTSLP